MPNVINSKDYFKYLLVIYYGSNLNKEERNTNYEVIQQKMNKNINEINENEINENIINLDLLTTKMYRENNKLEFDKLSPLSLYKLTKIYLIKLDLYFKLRYFNQLYLFHSKEIPTSADFLDHHLIPTLLEILDSIHLNEIKSGPNKKLIELNKNKVNIPKEILPTYLSNNNVIEKKFEIKDIDEINYGNKFRIIEANDKPKKEVNEGDKDKYQRLKLKRISTNSNTIVKDDNMSWINAVLYAFISHKVLFQIYNKSLKNYKTSELDKFYNELLNIRNYDIASVSTTDGDKKVIFDKKIYIYIFFLANMYDLETFEKFNEITSELKTLIENDADIFKDYNVFINDYYFDLLENADYKSITENIIQKIVKCETKEKDRTFFEQTNMNELDPERMDFNPLNPKNILVMFQKKTTMIILKLFYIYQLYLIIMIMMMMSV